MRNRKYKEETNEEKISHAANSLEKVAHDMYLVTNSSAKYLSISEQKERLEKLIQMAERNLETIKAAL